MEADACGGEKLLIAPVISDSELGKFKLMRGITDWIPNDQQLAFG